MTYTQCPKCGYRPLPTDQSLPCACPACGVVLAKVGQSLQRPRPTRRETGDDPSGWRARLTHIPDQVDPLEFWFRVATLAGLTCWTWLLLGMDFRAGEMGASFIHRPLLVFHEAGHVVFMPFGQWVSVLGGTLGQLIMPVILAGALLFKNQDPFGAAIGLWFLGVSLLDIAPYMFDALHPQLTLLSGATGEAGGHDWIFLFSSLGWLEQSQRIGGLTHKLGALVVILALGWAAGLLRLQYRRLRQSDQANR